MVPELRLINLNAKSWAEAFGISAQELTSWRTEASPNQPLLIWSIQQQRISIQDYLEWAQKCFQIPRLSTQFTDQLPNAGQWNVWKKLYNWGPTCLPLGEWEGCIYVGLIDPEIPVEIEKSVIKVLVHPQDMDLLWNYYNQKNAPQMDELTHSGLQTPDTESSPDLELTTSNWSPEREDLSQKPIQPQQTMDPADDSQPNFEKPELAVREQDLKNSDSSFELPEGLTLPNFGDPEPAQARIEPLEEVDPEATVQFDMPEGLSVELKTPKAPLGEEPSFIGQIELQEPSQVKDLSQTIRLQTNTMAPTSVGTRTHIPPVPAKPTREPLFKKAQVLQMPEEKIQKPVIKKPVADLATPDPDESTFSQGFEFQTIEDTPQPDFILDRTPGPQSNFSLSGDDSTKSSGSVSRDELERAAHLTNLTKTLHQTKTTNTGTVSTSGVELIAYADCENYDQLGAVGIVQLLKYFEHSMLLMFRNNELKPWRWSEDWKPIYESEPHTIELAKASLFKIVYKTNLPYHGYVVTNDINQRFFNEWNRGQVPKHITIVPMMLENRMTGMVLGLNNERVVKPEEQRNLLRVTERLSEELALNFQRVKLENSKAS